MVGDFSSSREKVISTYNRGTHRIDYIFGTPNIIPYILNGGILLYHFLTMTDHRSLYIDIDLPRFLKCQPPKTSTIIHRSLRTNNPRGYQEYCKYLEQWINTSQIETTLSNLSTTSVNDSSFSISQIIKLEEEFTKIRKKAENRLVKQYAHTWSPQLKQAQHQVYYYKLWLSEFRTGKRYDAQRDRLSIPSPTIPLNQRQAQKHLRQAQHSLKKVKLQSQQLRE